MVEVPEVFDQPGAAFALLPVGVKFPPIEDGWQMPEKAHTFHEATAHRGNVGILAGKGYFGLDQDEPAAFTGLELPASTTWETRPGRLGMWFKVSDNIAEALAGIGKKADQAQLKLHKDGLPVGEVKLQRTYQVIPPSHKFIDPKTGNSASPGTPGAERVDYRLLDSSPPATITLADLLQGLQAIGITFSSKLEQNAAKLESNRREARQKRAEPEEARVRRYAEAALRDEVLAVAGSITGSRNEQLNRSAFALGQFISAGALSEAEVTRELSRAASNAGLERDEIDRTIRSGLESGARHPREIPDPEETGPKVSGAHSQSCQDAGTEPATDGGNAKRLIRLHRNNIKYCHTFKKWMEWDGHRWRIDGDGSTYRLCEDVIREIHSEASNCIDSKDRQEWAKFAIRSDSGRGYRDMLFLASINKAAAITSDRLDTNPWLLNTENLTIDLKTFEAREPSREDLITKSAGAVYDPSAKCPIWEEFLDKIFQGDKDLIGYVQRAAGYSLTGSMVEQVYFFCHGTGANGKSVFLATLRSLLGDYAKQASFDTFLIQHTAKVRNDLAALAGSRIITASEAEEGSRLSMQVIKSWTGGDPITARFLFGEDFTFKPVGKIWLAANTKPVISERNHAAWRRVHLIPFLVTIPLEEQDRELENKLLEELPGILLWALDGLKEYHRIGLQPPEAVKAATDAYRRENDSMAAFLSECCEVRKLAICKNSDLFNAYRNFCGMIGFDPLSQTKFSLDLSNKPGIRSTRNMHGMVWHGIDLKPDWKPCRVDEGQNRNLAGNSMKTMQGMKANPESFQNSPHEGYFSEMPTYPTCSTLKEATDNDSQKSNPTSNPTYPGEPEGPAMSKIDREIPARTEAGKAPTSEKIQAAAMMEYGIAGWVDPAKVAHALKLPLGEVLAWLDANYIAYDRPGGGIGYRQRKAGGEARA